MNKFAAFPVILFVVVFTAVPILSVADSAKHDTVVISDSVRVEATIIAINKKDRELTLRGPDGHEVVVVAGDEVRNFKQIKKGDIVVVQYERAAASKLEKISDTDVAADTTIVKRAPKGAKPGMGAIRSATITAKVLEVDAKKRLLTVQGPHGGIVTIEVPASIKAFDTLKKGDNISAEYTEAVAISVHTPPKKK